MKKIAVIGKGKTGSAVLALLGASQVVGPFSQSAAPSAKALSSADAGIVFVPADGFINILPILLEAKIPMVIGTTGVLWTTQLDDSVKSAGVPWIVSSNYSPGMNLMLVASKLLAKHLELLGGAKTQITEWHHTHKKDSPSGTALALKRVVDREARQETPIAAIREGEHRGTHELALVAQDEILSIKHEALDRSIFAKGALLAAFQLLPQLKPGLHHYEDLMETIIMEKICKN